MALRKWLEDAGVDQIKDDQAFKETEYTAIQTYCENCGYVLGAGDLGIIKERGLEKSYTEWKMTYVKDLWVDFGEVPMNPITEEIEAEWRGFPKGTHREEIWLWFEESFQISVAEDLMGLERLPEKLDPEMTEQYTCSETSDAFTDPYAIWDNQEQDYYSAGDGTIPTFATQEDTIAYCNRLNIAATENLLCEII